MFMIFTAFYLFVQIQDSIWSYFSSIFRISPSDLSLSFSHAQLCIHLCLSMKPYLLIYFSVCIIFPIVNILLFLSLNPTAQLNMTAELCSFFFLYCLNLQIISSGNLIQTLMDFFVFEFLVMPMSPKGECSMCFVTSST